MSIFEKYYKKTAFKKILWNQLNPNEIYRTLQLWKVPKNLNIVSFGCGTGQKEIYAAKQGYNHIVALDISQAAIDAANLLAQKKNAEVKFYSQDILKLKSSKLSRTMRNPDLLIDWMSFHSIKKNDRQRYIGSVYTLNPRWFLIRTFSKTDSDYVKTKKDVLPSGIPGINRSFFDFNDLCKYFSRFTPLFYAHSIEEINPKKYIDRKVAAKIIILFINRKRIFI